MTSSPDALHHNSGVSLGDWLAEGRRQPELPTSLPEWLEPLVDRVRRPETDVRIHGMNRTVPELGPDGTPPRPSAVLVLLGEKQGQNPTLMLTHRTPTPVSYTHLTLPTILRV